MTPHSPPEYEESERMTHLPIQGAFHLANGFYPEREGKTNPLILVSQAVCDRGLGETAVGRHTCREGRNIGLADTHLCTLVHNCS